MDNVWRDTRRTDGRRGATAVRRCWMLAESHGSGALASVGIAVAMACSVAGCSDASTIEKKAVWLCERDYLEKPAVSMFPENVKPEEYVAAADLAALTAEDEAAGFFAVAAAGLKKVGVGSREALADHTKCEVLGLTIEEAGDRAVVKLAQTKPKWEMSNPLKTIGELAELESADDVRKKVGAMIDDADAEMHTIERELAFVKEENGWVALFEIEKNRQRAALDKEIESIAEKIATLNATLDQATAAGATLAEFKILSARFTKHEQRFGPPQPEIEMTVSNGTGRPVSHAFFVGTLRSPTRSVPWLEEAFNYAIPGGLEPGENATWMLSPNMFSKWGSVDAPADARLEIAVVRLTDEKDSVIAELPASDNPLDDKPVDVSALEDERAALQAQAAELFERKAAL